MSNTVIQQAGEISLTEKAAREIKTIMKENDIPETHGLRLGVKGGGCSGFTYSLGFDKELRDNDAVFEIHGVRLVIDHKSLFYLAGTELDFSDGLNGRGFVFNNPNAARTCGCGDSLGV
ncbi:MAG: iron-sulfur cluster assembly accessory protein [Chlorobi bacterium]|nr:iron-sulfur cluster assembly accessory protein [Chlorobiota bacterium]